MLIYSHRGESLYAPENTFDAFYYAFLDGSDGIETDVRITKDKVFVLIHDKTINRTSNSKLGGKVSNYTYKELLKFDFGLYKNKFYKGTKIVKLDDFLKYFSYKKMLFNIELKESGYEEEILKLINKYKKDNITIISFKYEILEQIRELDSNIKLGFIVYKIDNDTLEKIKKINISQVICISMGINEDDVLECHNNNLILIAWGVMGNFDIKRLNQIGVDGIMYDSYIDAKKVLIND